MKILSYEIQGYDYIELNKLLKIMNLVESGGEANTLIGNEEVKVNSEMETRKRRKLRKGDSVEFQDILINVN